MFKVYKCGMLGLDYSKVKYISRTRVAFTHTHRKLRLPFYITDIIKPRLERYRNGESEEAIHFTEQQKQFGSTRWH